MLWVGTGSPVLAATSRWVGSGPPVAAPRVSAQHLVEAGWAFSLQALPLRKDSLGKGDQAQRAGPVLGVQSTPDRTALTSRHKFNPLNQTSLCDNAAICICGLFAGLEQQETRGAKMRMRLSVHRFVYLCTHLV